MPRAWADVASDAYEAHAARLWEYARRIGQSPERSDDVVQEAFARLLSLPRWRRPQNVAGWLYRVVRNRAIDELRRERRVSFSPSASRHIDDRAVGDHADRVALWNAVDQLPLRQGEVIYLRYRAGLDYRLIGTILGVSESGARANAHRAIESLRRIDMEAEL